jgi:hypothetical protein
MARRSRQDNQNRIILYLVLFLALLFLFFRFGLQIFIDTAFYLTQGRQSVAINSKQAESSKVAIVTDPILESLPDATNEATLQVRGRANPENKVTLYQNSAYIDSINTDYDGNFEFEVTLEENINKIYIEATDTYSNNSRKSKVQEILFLNKEPTLEISNIEDNKKYYNSQVNIEGKTDKEVFIRVNQIPVVVRADGGFNYSLNLKPGENKLTIEAKDQAGNAIEKSYTLIFVE